MIPLEEILRNFKSHENTVVPFERLSVAAIIGDNGSGKTTILEGITEALQGKTPPTESREVTDDELIKLGETEGGVDFMWTHKGQTYLTIRKKSTLKGKKSSSTLSQLMEDNSWKPIAEGKAVTPKIEEILGQDYESFTATSMIMQGKGERLLVLPPRERFNLFFDLFGYNRYAEYEKTANKEADARATRRETLEKLVADLLGEAAYLTDHESNLAEAETRMAELQPLLAGKKEQLKALYEKAATLRAEIQQHEKAEKQHAKIMADIANMERKEQELLRLKELPEDILPRASSLYKQFCAEGGIEEASKAKAEAAARIADIRKIAGECATLRAKVKSYDTPIRKLTDRIAELKDIVSRKDEIDKASERLSALEKEMGTLRTSREALQAEMADLNNRLQEVQALKTERARLAGSISTAEAARTASVKAIEKDIQKARSDSASLDNATCHGIGKYAACPLIATAVAQRDALPLLEEQLAEATRRPAYPEDGEIAAIDERIRGYAAESMADRLAKATAEAKEQADATRRMEKEGKALQATSNLSAALATAQSDISTAEGDIARYRSEIDEAAGKIAQLEAREAELPAMQAEHDALEAVTAQFTRKAEAEKIASSVATLRQTADGLATETALLPSKRSGLDAIEANRTQAESDMARAENDRNELVKTIVTEKNAAEQCRKASAAADENGKEISVLEYEEKVFRTIAEACRKIPYIMIENLLPIIEDETNSILSQISDTDLMIQLRARKADSSSAGIKDTLDIQALDNAGARNVKLFSPGERTRIALALTIGIAEATAKRAGIVIETLFIDEPASLDEKGFEQFGRCIQKLARAQARVKKVFVITHSPILREMFDQRIEVEKIASTSTITVIT